MRGITQDEQTRLEQTQAAPRCWSCGAVSSGPLCPSCGKIQPPTGLDYFAFFGLPKKLNLDLAALESSFYRLSRKLHPDLNARADQREQAWSLEQSSLLNDAYRTLKDPVRRTQYLLKLESFEFEEQSKNASEKARASGELKNQIVPADLLESVFELNMQLEELRANRKSGNEDPALAGEVRAQKAELEAKMGGLIEELQQIWTEWDAVVELGSEADGARVRDQMVDVLNRRKYIGNLLRDLSKALETGGSASAAPADDAL
jgi:molecular chaperone HscB